MDGVVVGSGVGLDPVKLGIRIEQVLHEPVGGLSADPFVAVAACDSEIENWRALADVIEVEQLDQTGRVFIGVLKVSRVTKHGINVRFVTMV